MDHLERRLEKHMIRTLATWWLTMWVQRLLIATSQSARKPGAQHGTINRELALPKRMFRLGHQSKPCKVDIVPTISRLVENDARSGFVETEKYQLLKAGAEEL